MKQQGVNKSDMSFLIKGIKAILDSENITPKAAFNKKIGGIKGISVSGRTLRRMFDGEHLHVNTIRKIIKDDLKQKTFLENGILNIDHERDNISSDRPADGEAVG